MAKAYRRENFDSLMAKVKKVDYRVKEYLQTARYDKWSRIHAPINRGRMMTSNIVKCINVCLVEACQLPILDILKKARILFETWHCKNREISSYTKKTLGRRFKDILILKASKCSNMKVYFIMYQVIFLNSSFVNMLSAYKKNYAGFSFI